MLARWLMVLAVTLGACTSAEVDEPIAEPALEVDEVTTTNVPATEDVGSSSTGVRPFLTLLGDCHLGDPVDGKSVSCDLPHTYEVYREALLPSEMVSFDAEAIDAYADEVCATSLDAYVPTGVASGLGFTFVRPTAASWVNEMDPDRVVTCLLFDESGRLLTGRAGGN